MARPASQTLTPREAEIMAILWDNGSATADGVRSRLTGNLHDSTVRTLLRILERKGYVRHTAKGKTYMYRPAISRRQVEQSALRMILERFFGGSREALLLRLIEDEELREDQLKDLQRFAHEASRRRKGKE